MKKRAFVAAVASVVFTLTILLIPSYSLAGGVEQADRPIWNVGDIRTFQNTVQGKKAVEEVETVTAVSSEGYTVAVNRNGKKTIEVYSLDLILIKKMDESGKEIPVRDTGISTIRWPLKVGESWSEENVFLNRNSGQTVRLSIHAEVTKEGPLFKITTTSTNEWNVKIVRFERWFSPETGCFVKTVSKRIVGSGSDDFQKELVSFTPGK